jgi:DNA/RNA endonuclease YhcR with UshA esterase domain
LLFSCGKSDKPEYVDERPVGEPVTKQDSLPVTSNKDSVNNRTNTDREFRREETPVAVISPLDATEYMGKYVTVRGFVADVHKSEKVAYLNFVKRFPENPFSAVIFAREFEAFGDLNKYSGKDVEVTGRVSTYRGKPQMILDKPSQIKIAQ